jgi:hypothetical protein
VPHPAALAVCQSQPEQAEQDAKRSVSLPFAALCSLIAAKVRAKVTWKAMIDHIAFHMKA